MKTTRPMVKIIKIVNNTSSSSSKRNVVFKTNIPSTNRSHYSAPTTSSSSNLPLRRNREEENDNNNQNNNNNENEDENANENVDGNNLPDQYRAEVFAWQKHQGHVLEKDGYRWNLDPSDFYEIPSNARNDLLNACLTELEEDKAVENEDGENPRDDHENPQQVAENKTTTTFVQQTKSIPSLMGNN